MSTPSDDASIIVTLEHALQQSKEQLKKLEEQSQLIDHLKLENERLRSELAAERKHSNSSHNEQAVDPAEVLLRRDLQNQHEIERLKQKLKTIKVKVQRCGLGDILVSSPMNLSSSSQTHSQSKRPARSAEVSTTISEATKVGHPSTSEIHTAGKNATIPASSTKKRKLDGLHDAAISAVAEDGEHFGQDINKSLFPESSSDNPKISGRTHERLGELLSRTAPPPTPLDIRRNASPVKKTGTSHVDKHNNTPDTRRASDAEFSLTDLDLTKVDKKGTIGQQSASRRPRFLRQGSSTGTDVRLPRQEKARLSVEGADSSSAVLQCPPGCMKRCCSGKRYRLGSSHLVLPARYRNMSDHDILLQYLGYGSDDKIRALTTSARENLLHEAKTKIIADDNRGIRDLPARGTSPAGFWTTDFPASQGATNDTRAVT